MKFAFFHFISVPCSGILCAFAFGCTWIAFKYRVEFSTQNNSNNVQHFGAFQQTYTLRAEKWQIFTKLWHFIIFCKTAYLTALKKVIIHFCNFPFCFRPRKVHQQKCKSQLVKRQRFFSAEEKWLYNFALFFARLANSLFCDFLS